MNVKKRFGDNVIVHWQDRKRWSGMPISFTRYYLIEKPGEWIKFFCETGILASHIEEVQLYKIEDFTLNQTLTNKIWNEGTIIIKSNDKTAPLFKMVRVANPYKVYDLFTSLVARDRKERNFRWGEFQ